jgi:hypothetical protein
MDQNSASWNRLTRWLCNIETQSGCRTFNAMLYRHRTANCCSWSRLPSALLTSSRQSPSSTVRRLYVR